jgi:ribosome biogenesis GTPase / thiamine phosphate phosphatase
MNQEHLARLQGIGLTPELARRIEESLENMPAECTALRVVAVHRETLQVHDGECEFTARLLPWLARELSAPSHAVAVGDWVLAARDEHAQAWVHARVEPVSRITRRDGDGRAHAVVSNVQAALLTMGLDDDFNLRRLERFLALVQSSGVVPVVVLTKADLAARTPQRAEQCLAALRSRLGSGLPVLCVDARDATAVQTFQPWLSAGQTLVLLGSSGAGKSTLTNSLLGAALQDTGPVRESDLRGQHTTTSRTLFRLPSGACIIDTPGVRTLSLDAHATLAASFSDIETLRGTCRFRDCRHLDEPGCAVRSNVDADRLRNYHKLQREMGRDSMSALQRREQLSMWKARGKAAGQRLKAKRGED